MTCVDGQVAQNVVYRTVESKSTKTKGKTNSTILFGSKTLVFHREETAGHPQSPGANQLYDFDLLESVGFS